MDGDVKIIEDAPGLWNVHAHALGEIYAEFRWAYPMSGDHHPRVERGEHTHT